MDLTASPDLPAYICYLLVLLFGLLVARSQVNLLLGTFTERWGFLGTWMLFWAYAAVPVILFWFLDYSGALQDTSLFAALVVAFGYRQIFSGGVTNIQMPGSTARLWKPFQDWVNRVQRRIAWSSTRYSERFDDRVRRYLASDTSRIQSLLALAIFHSSNRGALEKKLEELDREQVPQGIKEQLFAEMQNRKRVRVLLEELRAAEPEDYGYFLRVQKVIPWWKYAGWFGNARSRAISWAVTATVITVVVVGGYFAVRSRQLNVRYMQWRFAKANATDRDRFRTHEFFSEQLKNASSVGIPRHDVVASLLLPLLARLRYKAVPTRTADDLLRLVTESHSSTTDSVIIPELIESLRTENPDVRLRIQSTLKYLKKADYDQVSSSPSMVDWVPSKDDSPADVDVHLNAWRAWWEKASAPGPSP